MRERVGQAGSLSVRDQRGKIGFLWVCKFDYKSIECFFMVFVGGLVRGTVAEEIRKVFAHFGWVMDLHLLMRDG